MKKLIFILLLCIASVCQAETINATVLKVYDGDTITVETSGGTRERVRFAAIDAPEAKQAFGQESKEALSELVRGRDVVLDVQGRDMYGRLVSFVSVGNIDVNGFMVMNGYAWHYRAYDNTDRYDEYQGYEDEARENRINLWSQEQPTAPWIYRRLKKKGMI